MVGVGEEAADDGGDSLRLVGEGGEDDAGLEGDGVKSLESQGDKIMEGAEAAGDRDYARDAADEAQQIETDIEATLAQAVAEATAAAAQSARDASGSAVNAAGSATLAESYAKGGTGTREGENTDNSLYYKQQAALSAEAASRSETAAGTSARNAGLSETAAAEANLPTLSSAKTHRAAVN